MTGRRETRDASAASLNILTLSRRYHNFTRAPTKSFEPLYTRRPIVFVHQIVTILLCEGWWGTRYSAAPCQADSHRTTVYSRGQRCLTLLPRHSAPQAASTDTIHSDLLQERRKNRRSGSCDLLQTDGQEEIVKEISTAQARI